MTGDRPARRKPKSSGCKARVTLTEEEKVARHRQASREYYQRNLHIREKNRLHAAEVLAAKKARRRRWDPPKAVKKALPSLSPSRDDRDDSVSPSRSGGGRASDAPVSPSRDPRSEDIGDQPDDVDDPLCIDSLSHDPPSPSHQVRSPYPARLAGLYFGALPDVSTPAHVERPQEHPVSARMNDLADLGDAERVAIDALAAMAQPREMAGSVDSILEKAMLLTSIPDTTASDHQAHESMPLAPAAMVSRWVRDRTAEVAALNARPLAKPTVFDRQFWTPSENIRCSTGGLAAGDRGTISEWSGRIWKHGDDGEFQCACQRCMDRCID
ncbi:hypothetical protein DFH09DRAFT_1099383 [Mycena vulgaris]|nr:hypothetical protein DFH09DRAFT_1099383 [Mycena vulgaris]